MEYYSAIAGAAHQHKTTTGLWADIRAQQRRTGRALPAGAFTAVNELRSIATAVQVASERFAKLSPSEAITSAAIGRPAYALKSLERTIGTRYMITFEHTMERNGELVTTTHTTFIYGVLPATKAEVLDQVKADAALMAPDYNGATSISISNLSVMAY